MGKIDLPKDIKHDLVVTSFQRANVVPVSLDEFKKIANSWFAGDVQLHDGKLCKWDMFSRQVSNPVEYKLTYAVEKGDVWYTTTIDLSKQIKPIAERNYGPNVQGEAICRLENNKVYVRFEFLSVKGENH